MRPPINHEDVLRAKREMEILYIIRVHLTRIRAALHDDFQIVDDAEISRRIREAL